MSSRPRSDHREAIEALSSRAAPPATPLPSPGIGLIGCGAISEMHLRAYKKLGLNVVALCSRRLEDAEARAREFFPEVKTLDSCAELLALEEVEVVDLATHPSGRIELIRAALEAGKNVLSQKPFVLSLAEGRELADFAERQGLRLAVNQNGRWAPHLAMIREAVKADLVGVLEEIDISVAWDHSWTVGTAFDRTAHLVLFDFGVHWFDFIVSLLGDREVAEVEASVSFSTSQSSPQPMLAKVEMRGDGFRASIAFDGDNNERPSDTTRVVGRSGVLLSEGSDLSDQALSLFLGGERVELPLAGDWFSTGFEGSMCELIDSVRRGHEPLNNARENLRSLQLAFAACASADLGEVIRPGSVESFPSSG
jgi:predicted dehydrogenase